MKNNDASITPTGFICQIVSEDFFQHQIQPNARWQFENGGVEICFYAIKDILSGKEIFIDYYDKDGLRVLGPEQVEEWKDGILVPLE